jgi:putative ABC transport system permease protein
MRRVELRGRARLLADPMVRLLAARNLRADRFGTLAAVLGIALGSAIVDVVVILDHNTTRVEAERASSSAAVSDDPTPDVGGRETITLTPVRRDGAESGRAGEKKASREDYEVLRAGIRGGSLLAFLVGALIVFFTFGAVVDRRRREVGLLRSLGALPAQVAAVFVREAVIIGGAGAALGLVTAIPLSLLAARLGVTTTGHLKIAPASMDFPWPGMALASLVGAAMALLGVVGPVRKALRLGIAGALRPGFLSGEGPRPSARRTPIALIVAPVLLAAHYLWLRPFTQRALPTLPFHVLEAAGTCLVFLAVLVGVPDLVRRLGGIFLRLIPGRESAARLVTRRRVEHLGHELVWSVSGVMMVASLLLVLHVVTHGLKREVATWADEALHDETFVLPWYPDLRADSLTPMLPPGERFALFSGRTPWPNAVHAVAAEDLAALAEEGGRPDLAALARRLGPGKILLSTLMARRLGVREGDALDLSGKGGARRLTIVGVTDGLGFTPMNAPHRNARTYGVIDAADEPLIAPYAGSIGTVAVVAHGSHPGVVAWQGADAATLTQKKGIYLMPARFYKNLRLREANSDFLIFDLILALTSALAGVGIANQLVLSMRARQREIALYRVLGMRGAEVRRVVLLEGAFIGLVGGWLAVLLGAPLAYTAVSALCAVSAFDVTFSLPPLYALLTVAGAVLVAVGASLLPASRAVRSDAAASVHHE